jgi:hypothetical protein
MLAIRLIGEIVCGRQTQNKQQPDSNQADWMKPKV